MADIRDTEIFPELDGTGDQRLEYRYLIENGCTCEVAGPSGNMTFQVENISVCGLLLGTPEPGVPFSKGDRVRVATRCRETNSCLADAEGEVVRITSADGGTKVGIEYDLPLGLHKVGCHVLSHITLVKDAEE